MQETDCSKMFCIIKVSEIPHVSYSAAREKMALNGRVAIVTGAALGIGKALTEMLLQNGAKVAAALQC